MARAYQRRTERHLAAGRPAGDPDTHPASRPSAEPEPAHIRVWSIGHQREMGVSQTLDAVEDINALHDRRIPGYQVTIDHVAVAPSGVWVIAAKRYVRQRIESTDRGSLFRSDPRLLVGRRDRTALVEAMAVQQRVVTAAIGQLGAATVCPVLCVVDADWPWLPRTLVVRGVTVCWPRALPALLGRPGPLGPGARAQIAERLALRLPPG